LWERGIVVAPEYPIASYVSTYTGATKNFYRIQVWTRGQCIRSGPHGIKRDVPVDLRVDVTVELKLVKEFQNPLCRGYNFGFQTSIFKG